MEHRGAELWLIKEELAKEYREWCEEWKCKADQPENMIEYLIQKRFIQGKAWLEWIDNMPRPNLMEMLKRSSLQFMREGFIPPKALIGRREK